ncbi:IS3 family transposase, partial [Phytohabitans kaempferiae]|uniref:IS3 family transposase n=1 Tax=Phytohabitans kaempferiae TaxID=1620943 RepID=UPI00406BBBA4
MAGFISSQRTEHGVSHAVTCRALQVSQSWYYKWRDRQPTPVQRRRAELDEAIRDVFDASGGTYGSPRVTLDLRAAGWRVGENTVARRMAALGLAGRAPKRRRNLTRQGKRPAAPDRVGRKFGAPAPDVLWCGDLKCRRRHFRSATHIWFGPVAVKSRLTRSAGRLVSAAGRVVRGVLSRSSPRSPDSRISRSTVHRATSTPLSVQFVPDLAGPVDAVVLLVGLFDHRGQLLVTPRSGRGGAGRGGVVGRWCDLGWRVFKRPQNPAGHRVRPSGSRRTPLSSR